MKTIIFPLIDIKFFHKNASVMFTFNYKANLGIWCRFIGKFNNKILKRLGILKDYYINLNNVFIYKPKLSI